MLTTLALSIAADLWGAQVRTQRAKVHEAWEGDCPEALGVDYIAAIELEKEPALETWVSKHGAEQ